MKTIQNIINIVDKVIGDIISPVSCLSCNKKEEIICDDCISQIKLAERETENNIMAMFDYREEIVRKMIWGLKYHKKWFIGKRLGKILYENFLEEIEELREYTLGQKIIVIPVPISKNRNKNRGYNQAEIIAKSFYNSNRGIFEFKNNIIYKIKDTLPQAKITNRNKRLKNMIGVFSINKKYNSDKKEKNNHNSKEQVNDLLKGRTVIVIDDVTTTGATISEIIKILKKNKAKKILGLTVAH